MNHETYTARAGDPCTELVALIGERACLQALSEGMGRSLKAAQTVEAEALIEGRPLPIAAEQIADLGCELKEVQRLLVVNTDALDAIACQFISPDC